jgi:hypothetical protein
MNFLHLGIKVYVALLSSLSIPRIGFGSSQRRGVGSSKVREFHG